MEARAGRYAGLSVILASFAVYLLTLAPEVTFWDSGELAYGAATLGIPHPPGYPVYCIAGRIFSLLPFGNVAYRLNVMSAVFGALASYVMFRLLLAVGGNSPAKVAVAVSAALLFAFTGPLWAMSVVAEVYALNAFLLCLLALVLFLHNRDGREAYLHVSALLLGLALVNHQSAVFLIPAYAYYYLRAGGVLKEPRRLVVSAFFFMLGLSALLYLPVRASTHPKINVGDPEVLYWFKWVVKISEHADTLMTVPQKAASLAKGMTAFSALALLAAAVAVIWALRKKPYTLFLAIAAVSYYGGMKLLTVGYVDIGKWGLLNKFFIPAILFGITLAVMLAYAIFATGGGGSRRAGKAAAMFAWILLVLPAGAVYYNYHDNDNSRNFFAFDFASNTLKSVMQDGALFAWGDNGVFPVWYLQGQERYRDDVLFIHTELMTHPWYMAGVIGEVYRKYGIRFEPPSNLSMLKTNVPILKFTLEKRAPTYFDYSAAGMLGIELSKFSPQGLVHLVKSWHARRLQDVWNSYTLRGAIDDTTNKSFAAEGILDIYAYECGVWARLAADEGRPGEALEAYKLMRELGGGGKFWNAWVERVSRELDRR